MTRILLALLLSLAPALAQERQVQGLTAPVEIITDRWGIPHINASSHEDAFFGQGYAAATARLWQLDLTRRRQLGRLAEEIGALDETAGEGVRPPNYNVAPTTDILAVVARHDDPARRTGAQRRGIGDRREGAQRRGIGDEDPVTRRIRRMRWGLLPPWAKPGPDGAVPTRGRLLINARRSAEVQRVIRDWLAQLRFPPGVRVAVDIQVVDKVHMTTVRVGPPVVVVVHIHPSDSRHFP
jgi:hypothetical protein